MEEPPGADAPYPGRSHSFVIAIMGSITALTLLFSSARIYCRLISIKMLALEDYIVILSIVSAFPSIDAC